MKMVAGESCVATVDATFDDLVRQKLLRQLPRKILMDGDLDASD